MSFVYRRRGEDLTTSRFLGRTAADTLGKRTGVLLAWASPFYFGLLYGVAAWATVLPIYMTRTKLVRSLRIQRRLTI